MKGALKDAIYIDILRYPKTLALKPKTPNPHLVVAAFLCELLHVLPYVHVTRAHDELREPSRDGEETVVQVDVRGVASAPLQKHGPRGIGARQ